MKKLLFITVIALFVSGLTISCNNEEKKTETTEETEKSPTAQGKYYCPMHPEVSSDEPGKTCDKCGGMELVERETTE